MPFYSTMDMPIYTEEEAPAEIAEIYAEIKQALPYPNVPNLYTALSSSPAGLAMFWQMGQAYFSNLTIPQSLVAMISYTIATKSECEYCSSAHELNCRTMGVNEETLSMLVKDLENLNPRRVQVIIDFAYKAAKHPQELSLEDYDMARDEGVTDAELVEIIMIAGVAVLSDIVADALKIEVDSAILQGLGRVE